MNKKSFFTLLILFNVFLIHSQERMVFTSDVDHFWEAYDSIRTTDDSTKQLQYIRRLYIDRGTPGLLSFMKLRDYTAEGWVKQIRQYPKFWQSIRPNTYRVKNAAAAIEATIAKFKQIYPALKPAKMYFTIGGLLSGGTTSDDMVLIGSEIATGDSTTDVSEFPSKWLAGVFREQKAGNFVNLNVHEYVHTQQHGESTDLLGQSIAEGACDFITELVTGKPMRTNYIIYGLAHENELKQSFREQMFTNSLNAWLYNGSRAKTVADLGYFMGYRIAGAYYEQAKDKKAAVKNIIELNYSDTSAVTKFLVQSNYYPDGFDKVALLAAFRAKQPLILSIDPITKDSTIDAAAKEITIHFSRPMQQGMSIQYLGKLETAITSAIGWSADKKSLSLKIEAQPGKTYGFIVANSRFTSEDGYPIESLSVRFTAK